MLLFGGIWLCKFLRQVFRETCCRLLCVTQRQLSGVRNNRLVTEGRPSCRRKGYFKPTEKANPSADSTTAQDESRVNSLPVTDDQDIEFNGNAILFEEQVLFGTGTVRDFAGNA